jgi:hypothetical protein
MLNELLAQALVSQRQVQGEHRATQARLLREAARGRRPPRAGLRAGLHPLRRTAAAGVAAVGGWLVRAGSWLQAAGPAPASTSPRG